MSSRSMGSHGMQAFRFNAMIEMIEAGRLMPQRLVGERMRLDEVPAALMKMDQFPGIGISVVTSF